MVNGEDGHFWRKYSLNMGYRDVLVVSENDLLHELAARNVHIVTGGQQKKVTDRLPTAVLLTGLVQNGDARLHLALIALFLAQPAAATAVPAALSYLDPMQQTKLKLFYTAAMLLQQIYQDQLRQYVHNWQPLPDLFADSLSVNVTAAPEEQLLQLGQRHQELSGVHANWPGSYRYAVKRLLSRLSREMAWAT